MKKGSKSPQKIAIIAYIMKGCLRFYTCIFWTLPNLSKYIYGLSSLEQHHKIEKKNTDTNVMQFFVFWKNPVGEAQGTWTLDTGLLKLKKPVLTQI
jgi:hypothetical protein